MGHDLNAALLFVRVVDAGSFRGAARALGIPKSTVSRKLAELERRLGARLLQRTTRQIGLTDVGRGYYEQASAAIGALLDAERGVAEQLGEPRGALRITSSVNVGTLLLPPILFEFLARYPQVRVSLDLSERIVDLVQEGFDLALRAGPLADSSLIARRLGASPMHVYGSPAYLRLRGRPKEPRDLVDHECLLFAAWQGTWSFTAGRKAIAVKVAGRLCSNNMALLCNAAIAGVGLARLPSLIAEPGVREKKLVRLLEEFTPLGAPLHVLYPSARFVSPSVRAFVELLQERVGAVL
jgi:DNA-binding transcriptional LysR family regulator